MTSSMGIPSAFGKTKCAVTSPASVLQVLAPPGSGKTKTLTARVANLLAHCGFKPWNIIVCTFTIKAAREMKERIRSLVGEELESKLHLGTFHSVARRYLSIYGHYIGIEKNFGIADSSDTLAIIKRVIKRRSYGIEPSVSRSRISGLKAKNISPEQYLASQKTVETQEFASLYSEYEETLKASNLLDYDDLLLRCCDLLRKRPESVSNIEAVLIDEFQDTNHIQYELMTLFAQKNRHITIVGDPDQSIYGFRSAEIKNLLRMQSEYRDTLVVHLEENYRSSAAILLSAVEVIEQDESRPAKRLLPTHVAGEQPVLRRLPTAAAEAEWLVSEINRIKLSTGHLFSHNDFSILLRSAALSRHIESALGKAGIPYRLIGGHRFYDRVEIKLVLDYLRVVNQPTHNDALIRVINVPSRKIGEVTVKSLLEEAETEKLTLWELILGSAQGYRRPKTKLSAQAQKGIDCFVNIILTSQRKLNEQGEESCPLVELIGHIFRKLSFEDYLKKSYPEDFDGRWANVEELLAQAQDVVTAIANGGQALDESLPLIAGLEQNSVLGPADMLNRFLANVALATEVQSEGSATVDQVTISTIHAAKGLEWPVVFIPAAYQGSIPHSRAEDTDEERRLLYVGMTRAQALLYLSCPMKNSQKEDTTMCPFLTHKRTKIMFAPKGSSIGYSTTQDLARILRRSCPQETVINACRKELEHVDDDQWPESGEAPFPHRDHAALLESTYGYSKYAFAQGDTINERKQAAIGITTSVTMDKTQTFSMSTTTIPSGFMSAGARMKEIEVQADIVENERERNMLKRQASPQKPSKATKKKVTGQGSITNFFSKPKLSEGTQRQREPLIRAETLTSGPVKQVPKLERAATAPVDHKGSTSIDVVPPYTTHKVKATTGFQHRRKISDENDPIPSTRYVLLSSSPAKQDEEESAKIPLPDPPTRCNIQVTRPAATFHTTSMSHLDGNGIGPRKTLGVRRSMQGWSSKTCQPFRAPGRPK